MKRDIDFLSAYRAGHKSEQRETRGGAGGLRRALLIGAGNVLAAAAITGGLVIYQRAAASGRDALYDYVHDSEEAARYAEILARQDEYTELRDYNNRVDTASAEIQGARDLSQQDYDVLRAQQDANGYVLRWYSEGPQLMLSLGHPASITIPDYVERVKRTERFAGVYYLGWEKEGDFSLPAGHYGFDLYATLTTQEDDAQ